MITNTSRSVLFATMVALLIITTLPANAQKWQPGRFTDVKGVKVSGFVRTNPGGSGPIKNEGFIEFKSDEKANPYKLSASDLISFVAGKDSFVVAHAPGNETWAKNDYDFVRVVINVPTKIYATRGAGSGGGGLHLSPGVGIGTGSYGSQYGGGLGISFGGGGGGKKSKMIYYYGGSTSTMQRITNENFIDVMSEVMGDEPEVVDRIRNNLYNLGSMDKLIDYFKKVKASR